MLQSCIKLELQKSCTPQLLSLNECDNNIKYSYIEVLIFRESTDFWLFREELRPGRIWLTSLDSVCEAHQPFNVVNQQVFTIFWLSGWLIEMSLDIYPTPTVLSTESTSTIYILIITPLIASITTMAVQYIQRHRLSQDQLWMAAVLQRKLETCASNVVWQARPSSCPQFYFAINHRSKVTTTKESQLWH